MKGELVCTSLDSESVPLVRFRSHDYVEVSDTECACGRTGFGIHIIGRTDALLILCKVIASFAPATNGVIEIQLLEAPPEGWERPLQIAPESEWLPGKYGDRLAVSPRTIRTR